MVLILGLRDGVRFISIPRAFQARPQLAGFEPASDIQDHFFEILLRKDSAAGDDGLDRA
jgi:hypothetical protein